MDFILQFSFLFLAAFVVGSNGHKQEFIDISNISTIYETDRLPTDEDGNLLPRYMASIGNGHIATTLFTDSVFMNGLYNGFKGESHRARIPSRNNIRVTILNPILSHRYALDLEKGIFTEKMTTADYKVQVTTFAHRYYHKVIVTQITAVPITAPKSLLLELKSITGAESEDIGFRPDTAYIGPEGFELPTVFACGETFEVEDPLYQEFNSTACVIATTVDSMKLITAGVIFTYFAAYDVDQAGAAADFNAVATLVAAGKHGEILDSHILKFRELWKEGRIEVAGNVQLEKVIYGSLYYILSSLPVTTEVNTQVGQFYGLSPGGLGYGTRLSDYQGHSFWDTEIWMYPPLLYFYPKAAREILNYRLHVIRAARDRANETSYSGARFPWEGCFTGREVTPDCCPETRDFQIHITADIAFAIRQYIAVTRDDIWLKDIQADNLVNGCGLIHEIAQFWISRTECNADKSLCEIKGVMPPDEDHHDVNNSVYTNVVAGYAIFFAKYAKCLCGASMADVPEVWIETAKSLKLIFDVDQQYHPEFDNYTVGTPIKQADVVLLGFPLMYEMDPEIRKNDLNIYEPVTRPDGPAMTWAMHTIGFLDLDEIEKAEAIFNRSYQSYVRQPFKIWTEAQPPTLGAVNFITGMGGFLQSIVSGYGGLRLYPEKIVFFKPRIPPQSDSLKLVGINFLENEFDLFVEQGKVTVTFTTRSVKYPPILENSEGANIPIVNNITVINTTAGPVTFTLKTATETFCPLPLDKIKLHPIRSESTTIDSRSETTTTDSRSESTTTDSRSESTTTDSRSESTTTDSRSESTTTDSRSESTTTDSRSESTTTDSRSESTTTDSRSESTTTDSRSESTTTDSGSISSLLISKPAFNVLPQLITIYLVLLL